MARLHAQEVCVQWHRAERRQVERVDGPQRQQILRHLRTVVHRVMYVPWFM